jgi:hypothetical protein
LNGHGPIKKEESFGLDSIVISPDNVVKRVFSFVIILLALISTFLATYLACFGFPESKGFLLFYYIIESLFLLDILLCFITQYSDEENNKPVREIKLIAIKYIKSGFVFDALATIPFHLLMRAKFEDESVSDQMNLLFLLKMFRFRKMMSLFETKNFQDFIKGLFKTRL